MLILLTFIELGKKCAISRMCTDTVSGEKKKKNNNKNRKKKQAILCQKTWWRASSDETKALEAYSSVVDFTPTSNFINSTCRNG